MSNIFESTKINSLLKDERFLYPEYIPEQLPFRDAEIGEMVFCLKPATQGKKPTNIFLTGKPGTGKTASSKYVLNELAEFSDRVKTLYINCFENNTKHIILTKITNFLGYPVPERGTSSEETYHRFLSILKTKNIIPVIVFDEAEQLLKHDETKKLLYDFSRLGEQENITIGLTFISNDEKFLSFLDDRTRSSLQASSITFDKYSCMELKEILKERVKYAFFPNVLGENVVSLCAAHAAKEGDARIAISVLLKAAREAERSNSKKVLISHVRKSFSKEKPIKFEIEKNFSEKEKQIIELVKKEKEITSNEVYSKLGHFAERTLRKAISELEKKGIILKEERQEGKSNTRIIKLAKRENSNK